MVDWKTKYLEMKLKYINAKYKLTGGDFSFQIGGAHAFSKGAPFFIMYPLKLENQQHQQVIRAVSERRSTLLTEDIRYDNEDPDFQLHFTLFHFQVNLKHELKNFFQSQELRDHIKNSFVNHLQEHNLQHNQKTFKILGDNFWGKEFIMDDHNAITNFRTSIYKFINSNLGEWSNIREQDGFTYFAINGNDLIAVPDYHYGVGNWLPHISILELSNPIYKKLSLEHKNNTLYGHLTAPQQLIDVLKDPNSPPDDRERVEQYINELFSWYIGKNMNTWLQLQQAVGIDGKSQRNAVVPFCDITLVDDGNPLHISMHRTAEHLNWDI